MNISRDRRIVVRTCATGGNRPTKIAKLTFRISKHQHVGRLKILMRYTLAMKLLNSYSDLMQNFKVPRQVNRLRESNVLTHIARSHFKDDVRDPPNVEQQRVVDVGFAVPKNSYDARQFRCLTYRKEVSLEDVLSSESIEFVNKMIGFLRFGEI